MLIGFNINVQQEVSTQDRISVQLLVVARHARENQLWRYKLPELRYFADCLEGTNFKAETVIIREEISKRSIHLL